MARLAATLVAIALLSYFASAQNPTSSNPQAVAYAAQSIAAVTGTTTISDVTLTGTVAWNAGYRHRYERLSCARHGRESNGPRSIERDTDGDS